jgi:hypothetical protein
MSGFTLSSRAHHHSSAPLQYTTLASHLPGDPNRPELIAQQKEVARTGCNQAQKAYSQSITEGLSSFANGAAAKHSLSESNPLHELPFRVSADLIHAFALFLLLFSSFALEFSAMISGKVAQSPHGCPRNPRERARKRCRLAIKGQEFAWFGAQFAR